MLKVSVSRRCEHLTTLAASLGTFVPCVASVPSQAPSKTRQLHICLVHPGTSKLCFSGLFSLSVLEILFYLTLGNLLRTKVVRIQNAEVPRVSVNI